MLQDEERKNIQNEFKKLIEQKEAEEKIEKAEAELHPSSSNKDEASPVEEASPPSENSPESPKSEKSNSKSESSPEKQNSPSNKINSDDQSQKSKGTKRSKLIKKRVLESKIAEKSEQKQETKENSNKKTEEEKKPKMKGDVVQKETDRDEDYQKDTVPAEIVQFVNEFKKNAVKIIRNTGIYQKFRSVFHGVGFNIGKIDEFLEFGGGLLGIKNELWDLKIDSEVGFQEASIELMDNMADKMIIIE